MYVAVNSSVLRNAEFKEMIPCATRDSFSFMYYGGGALHITGSSSAIWTAASYLFDNSAGLNGGSLYVSGRSSANLTAACVFSKNAHHLRAERCMLLVACLCLGIMRP